MSKQQNVLSNTAISININGRTVPPIIPSGEAGDKHFRQTLNGSFYKMTESIRKQSALMQLEMDQKCDLSSTDVLNAYQKDIQMLEKLIKDIESTVKLSIHYSVRTHGYNSVAVKDEAWEIVQKRLPPILQTPLVQYSADRAILEPKELLGVLVTDIVSASQRVPQQFMYYLDVLVEQGFVGMVKWQREGRYDVGYYYYYEHDFYAQLKGSREEKTVDWNKMLETVTQVSKTSMQYNLCRHEHHIVDAQIIDVSDYTLQVPERIKAFVDHVPHGIVKYLKIVDGIQTMNRITSMTVGESEHVENKVISTHRYDPAVCIGDYALIGWDTTEQATERLTQITIPESLKARVKLLRDMMEWVLGIICASGIVALCFLLAFTYVVPDQHRGILPAIDFTQEFLKTHSGSSGMRYVAKGQSLSFQGKDINIFYERRADHNTESHMGVLLSQVGNIKIYSLPLRQEEAGTTVSVYHIYGKCDLWGLGYKANIYVFSADDDGMYYSISADNYQHIDTRTHLSQSQR